MASAARLGLRARLAAPRGLPQLAASRPCFVRASCPHAASPFTTSQSRPRGGASPRLSDELSREMVQHSPKIEMAKRMQMNLDELTAEAASMLIPGAFWLMGAVRNGRGRGQQQDRNKP